MAQPKVKPPISRVPRHQQGPFEFLIEKGLQFGLGVKAVDLAKKAFEYMEERNFEAIKAGEDYKTKEMSTYDNRRVDAPMTTQTGQAIYNMPRRGPEGEIINTPPMTGDRTATSYDMRTDSPGFGYYRDPDTGEILANRGPKAVGTPEVLKVAPKEESSRVSGEGIPNNPDDFQFYDNPEAVDYDINATKGISEELQRHDVNYIEEYETKDFRNKETGIPY